MDPAATASDTAPQVAREAPERGQGMVEYAFILMLVALLLILSVAVIGHTTTNMFSNVSNGLGN
jgi:Flp pilus assembly pilin Flp